MKGYDVTIEPTNLCNARCIFCPNRTSIRPKGFITTSTLFKIFDIIEPIEKYGINPVGLGEPFLHPHIGDVLKCIKDRFPLIPVRIATNGINLSKHIDMICNTLTENDSILVSLNTDDKEEYKDLMGIDAHDTVIDSLYNLIHREREFKIKTQFILTKQNYWKFPAFLYHWKPLVDTVMTRPLENWGGRVNVSDLQIYNPGNRDVKQIVFDWLGNKYDSCIEL